MGLRVFPSAVTQEVRCLSKGTKQYILDVGVDHLFNVSESVKYGLASCLVVNCIMVYWNRRAWRAGSLSIMAVLVLAEFVARICGLLEFPIYRADAYVGYWPAPGQSGRFLNRNHWAFNEHSMGVAQAFQPSLRKDVLLVGDSIVLGGNPLDQSERLGPRLTRETGNQHWPVSAGSWSLLNEIHFLKRNMDVVEQTDALVFVLNSADFAQPSSWTCDVTHPLERPNWALPFLVRKYLFAGQQCQRASDVLAVPESDWQAEWMDLMQDARVRGKPVEVWLYPTKLESQHAELLRERLESVAVRLQVWASPSTIAIRSLSRDRRWSGVRYVDAIHPDAASVGVLAQIMANPDSETLIP